MKFPLLVSFLFFRPVALVCVCALALYGCSGSSDSTSGDEQAGAPTTTTLVNFDITVPAYMSDELQVQLSWGDINATAAWVRDESWSISESFPANTENLLVVTFSDQNGAITLGTVEQNFRTGAGVSEDFQITADQFDTNQWDSDNDGESNLSELIAGTNPNGDGALDPAQLPTMPQASLELIPDKTFRISWTPSADSDFYRVLENPDGLSGFTPVSENLAAATQSYDHRVALFNRINARYIVQACNTSGCVDSDPLIVTGSLDNAIGYFKASNTGFSDNFGSSVSLSADGRTLAVGARFERGAAIGVNGGHTDNPAFASGAVYVFVRSGGLWQQQAYIKASNADSGDEFGASVSLSADGNSLAVGADNESSVATGINGDQSDNSAGDSGAVYVFVRSEELWQQQVYIKASNTGIGDEFGYSVSLSADGNTLAVGAEKEGSALTGINGNQTDNSAGDAGAVYVFVRSDELWQQQAYIKASNTDASDKFGNSVSLSADGSTLAVGADSENSATTGINGDDSDNSPNGSSSGAVYVFVRSNGLWQQQAYVKASNRGVTDHFGTAVSLSADGNTLAVGSNFEDSSAVGINGDQTDNSITDSGAVYVFVRSDELWQQQAYLKASNTGTGDGFGASVSLSADGNTLAAGAGSEGSAATGINGDQTDNSASNSGAVYVFVRSNGLWQHQAYVKASNSENGDRFQRAILSADGKTLAVGAVLEDSAATGINGNQSDDVANSSGAVYLY